MLAAPFLLTAASAADRPVGNAFTTRSEAYGRNGMAATSQPLATLAAVDTLRAGGSAVDAAIAANAVLCVTEPTGCGVGGDLFAIVWDSSSERLYGLNASGRSPASLTLDEFQRIGVDAIPKYGVLPISVPGCVDGWAELHKKFGRLPLAEVLTPAIRHARDGYPVTPVIAEIWRLGAESKRTQPGFTEVFLPGGNAPSAGDVFKNPGLADTLERIAAGGADAFYRGDIARRAAAFVAEHGGYLSYDDFATHRSEWIDPVSVPYRGYDVWELPPNGQGIAALQMLRLLSAYDLRGAGFGSPNHLHWFAEAKKLAFEDRAKYYADPDFARAPVAGLISAEYAEERRALIRDDLANAAPEPGSPPRDGDTIYLAVGDGEGNLVSLIQSNYRGHGSGVCPTGLGFSLQNRGELFDLTPGRANSYAPRKRPFHTIIPAMLTRDGRPVLAFGVMGGDMQPQGHVQVLMNLLDFGMDLQEAGDAPRVRHFGSSEPTGVGRDANGGALRMESGFPAETIRELQLRGHRVHHGLGDFGGYQAVWRDEERGVYVGATESRKDGVALGY